MICPNCDAEYRDGFVTCSTCEVPLIAGTKPNEYRQQGGTPALVAGLLIGVSVVAVYAMRTLNASWEWYLGFVALAFVVYLIRSRYQV